MNSTCEKLQNLLEYQVREFRALEQRLEHFRAIEAELALRLHQSQFVPAHYELNDLLLDAYEFLVLRLWDACEALATTGGLFNQLRADCRLLDRKSARQERRSEDPILPEIEACRSAAFTRLFPGAGTKIGYGDIDGLKNRLFATLGPLKTARDKIHAHRIVERTKAGKPFSGVTLSIAAMDAIFAQVGQILTDLGFLLFDVSYPLDGVTPNAEDIVDLLLHGSMNALCDKMGICADLEGTNSAETFYWQRRQRFYSGSAWAEQQSSWNLEKLNPEAPGEEASGLDEEKAS